MNKKTLFITVLILLCQTMALGQACKVEKPKNVKFSSSRVILSTADGDFKFNTSTNMQQFELVYDQPFSTRPNVALAIQAIETDQTRDLSLAVFPGPSASGSTLPIIASTPWQKTNWKTLKINYLASDRSDLQIGQAFLGKDDTGRQVMFYNFKNPARINTSSEIISKGFVSGFDFSTTSWSPLGVRFESPNTNSTTTWCRVSGNDKMTLNNLLGSFVIFDPKKVNFLYSEGSYSTNFLSQIVQIQMPSNYITRIDSFLVGLSSFSFDTTSAISFTSSMNNSFILKLGPIYSNKINHIAFQYLILAYGACSDCIGFPIAFQGECVSECPKDYVIEGMGCIKVNCPANASWDGAYCRCNAGFFNLKGTCISCPQNNVFDEKAPTGCKCKDGFYLIAGKCTACGQNTFFNGTDCQCKPGYYLINRVCDQCKSAEQWYPAYSKCGIICGSNSKYDGSTCQCLPGFNLINGACDVCPYGQAYNTSQGKCYGLCVENEKWNGSFCNCADGFYRQNGVCDTCTNNSYWNGTNCVCLDGYYFVNCKCTRCPANRQWNDLTKTCELPQLACGSNEESNGYICVCKAGFTKKDGVCASMCPDLSSYSNGTCVCFVGYTPLNGVCAPNPNTSNANNGSEKPLTTAPITRPPITVPPIPAAPVSPSMASIPVLNPTFPVTANPGAPFYCSSNSYWNGVACVCNYGYSMVNGVCTPTVGQCQANQYWNGNACVCNIGYALLNGACTPSAVNPASCGVNMYWNGVACACNLGYRQINGICMTDVTGCYAPMVWANGGCSCPAGQALVGTTCLPAVSNTCPRFAYWNGVACVCQTGYCMTNGVCSPTPEIECGANAYFNGVSCRCMSGYYKTPNNLCLRCPIGKHWNGKDCIKNSNKSPSCGGGRWNGRDCDDDDDMNCVVNSFWDGVRCICNRGFYNVSGYCITCPQGTYYTGWSCVPGSTHNYCASNEFWNGNSCVCLNGFYRIGRDCVTCPYATTWNGVSCVPSGLQPLTCGANQQWVFNGCQCIPGFYPNGNSCSSTCSVC